MANVPQFQRLQCEFTAHVRDPRKNPAPAGIEDRRMKIYRELFYNNIEDCLANAFPVLRSISADEVWHARVRDFFARHRCRAPQFHKVAEEFLRFIDEERGDHADDPPFLRDLCHYEWTELELSISPLQLTPELADPNGDLLRGRPLLSPLAWAMAYDWPVQRIGADCQPQERPAQPTYLVVSRNRQDEVKFMEINAVTARLIELMQSQPQSSGGDLLAQIAAELHHPQPDEVIESGADILRGLRGRDIIVGTRRETIPEV